MRKQFVRIYLGIAVVLVLGAIGFLLLSKQWFDARRRADFEDRTRALISTIREELEEVGEDVSGQLLVLNMFSLTHRMPIWLKSMVEVPLSSEEKARIRAGDVVTVELDRGLRQTYAATSGGEVVILGPYRPEQMMRWRDGAADSGPRPMWRDEGMRERGRRPGGPGGPGGPGFRRFGEPGILWGPDYVFLGVLGVSFVCFGAVIYFLIRPLERRITALSRVAERFGRGDLSSRAEEVKNEDAFAELTGSFNGMADRIEGLVKGQQELLRAVSHELRTPLARLFFLANRLQKADLPEEDRPYVLRMQRSLGELNELVEELLSFGRLEGRLNPDTLEAVDVRSEVEAVSEVAMDLRPGISVEIVCDPMTVTAIPRYFRRALTNLVTNAVRHAGSRIRVLCCQGGEGVEVVVEDDGPGIPEGLREKVFEPFFRVDESRNEKIGGTGLGLAIVQRIVKLHGGSVKAEAGAEGGARFALFFPNRGVSIPIRAGGAGR